MSTRATPFRPAVVISMLAVGAGAFLLLLYAMGAGWTGQQDRNGGAHAASNALPGFSALTALLERRGHEVRLSREGAALDDAALLVVTPGQFSDAEQLNDLIAERRYQGPTMLALPKWGAFPLPEDDRIEAEEGWVILLDIWPPSWIGDVEQLADIELASGETGGWSGMGLSGALPDSEQVQAILEESVSDFYPLVSDTEGDMLAAWHYNGGYYPALAEASGERFFEEVPEGIDQAAYPLVVVAEPDLMNNYGLADETRARLAVGLIEATMGEDDLPIVFDLTVPGLGSSENLLTLAFRPPFVAATLCLILAALLIAWRGLARFGPARAEQPALAQGKLQLARNGAALIERARRWHLLGSPYAELVTARTARILGLRETGQAAREAAIDHALQLRNLPGATFSETAARLRGARRPAELVRAAAALKSIERTLSQ